VVTYRELLQLAVDITGYDRPIVTLPFWVGYLMAFFGSLLSTPPITRDMLYLMQHDNIVGDGEPGFEALGIAPRTMEAILPTFMDAYSRGGRWKGAARLT
jgi:NADH dehydrogenase